MSQLRIHTIDDPSVRQVSTEIDPEELKTEEMQTFLDDLVQAMVDANGIGIAATQVGRPIRAVVIIDENVRDYSDEHLVLINPRIVSASKKTSLLEAGCLSVPGVTGTNERAAKVRVKALTRDGEPIDIKGKGILSHILQHEVDHLDATLFIDTAFDITDTNA
jgi:peptide deformylase